MTTKRENNKIKSEIDAYALAIALVLAMICITASAASVFEGVWTVKDTDGKPFEITLSAWFSEGEPRRGYGRYLEGRRKCRVMTWTTGWTTKIMTDGDQYKKAAYAKGQLVDGKPDDTSGAKRRSEQ